ncbi:hypothetical protein ACFVG1_06615 [Streptomyces bacillaris]|uniref:hypothetical protein n=1 Tax=Streptomyces bacillaris TaxID=68179 RepID=UPI0035D575A4
MKRWQRPVRPLPLRVRPMQSESVVSFVMRLAAANDFPASLLFRTIGDCVPGKHVLHRDAILNRTAIDRLSILSRTPADHLTRALPGLSHVPVYVPLPARTPTVRFFKLHYPMQACRTCTLKHGPATPFAWEHRDRDEARYVCTMHRRWIKSTPQYNLMNAPEIVTAQNEYDALAMSYTQAEAASGLFQAWNITTGWLKDKRHQSLMRRWRARAETVGAAGPASAAARFPEMIHLAPLLIHPSWRNHVIYGAPSDLSRFLRHASRAVGTDYELFPDQRGREDPLVTWAMSLRSCHTSRQLPLSRRASSLRGTRATPLPESRHFA